MQIIVPIFILGVCKMVILVVHWDWAELCPVAPSSAISNVPAWAAAKWPSMTNSGYSECASALDNKNYPNLHNNEHGCLGIHPSGPFPPKALFVIHGGRPAKHRCSQYQLSSTSSYPSSGYCSLSAITPQSSICAFQRLPHHPFQPTRRDPINHDIVVH